MQMQVTEQDIEDMLKASNIGVQIIETQLNGIKAMVDNVNSLAQVVIRMERATPNPKEQGAYDFFTGLTKFLNGLGAEKQLEGQKLLTTVKQLEEAKSRISSNIIIPTMNEKNL